MKYHYSSGIPDHSKRELVVIWLVAVIAGVLAFLYLNMVINSLVTLNESVSDPEPVTINYANNYANHN